MSSLGFNSNSGVGVLVEWVGWQREDWEKIILPDFEVISATVKTNILRRLSVQGEPSSLLSE